MSIRNTASRLIQAGVAGQVFPGGTSTVWCREDDKPVETLAWGGRLRSKGDLVEQDTPYDLGSMTQLFVALTALRMNAFGELDLSMPAEEVLGDVRGGSVGSATVNQLLRHQGGLDPWGALYLDVPHDSGTPAAKRWILSEASRRARTDGLGESMQSDLGYLIAGEVMSKTASLPLDTLVAHYVTRPLGIDSSVRYAATVPVDQKARWMRRAAPGQQCDWRGNVIQGEVDDENCWALGGVSGHAGLFGTARGVAVMGRAILDVLKGRSDFLALDVIRSALDVNPSSGIGVGWRRRHPLDAAGKRLAAESFGAESPTGTSIWCDPSRDLVIVLLTNRVHPTRANTKIQGFRPAFHDGVVAAVEGRVRSSINT
ncbi:MAG: serine hydrolase domain-containing protein [Myxococcota bacterium]